MFLEEMRGFWLCFSLFLSVGLALNLLPWLTWSSNADDAKGMDWLPGTDLNSFLTAFSLIHLGGRCIPSVFCNELVISMMLAV